MAIEPIKGFYVHDEATNTDGVAKYDYNSLKNAPVGIAETIDPYSSGNFGITTDSLNVSVNSDGTFRLFATTAPFDVYVFPCNEGDAFVVNGTGGANVRLWCFTKEITEGVAVVAVTAKSTAQQSQAGLNNEIVYAPAQSAWAIFQFKDGGTVAKLENGLAGYVSDKIEYIEPLAQNNGLTVGLINTHAGQYVTVSNDAITIDPSITWQQAVIPCNEGDVFLVNGKGGSGDARLWGFLPDIVGETVARFISICNSASSTAGLNNEYITAPAEAKYAIFNMSVADSSTNKNKIVKTSGLLSEVAKNSVIDKADLESIKNHLRFLVFGNSYGCDYISYVPFILKNMGITCEIYFYERDALSLRDLYNRWESTDATDTETDGIHAGTYYRNTFRINTKIDTAWHTNTRLSAKQCVELGNFDFICMQQWSAYSVDATTYEPWLSLVIDLIRQSIDKPTPIVWTEVCTRPTHDDKAGALSAFENAAIKKHPFEFSIPYGTAIFNARTNNSLAAIGDYTNHNLWASDGVHLQDGLPRYIASLGAVEAICRHFFPNKSVLYDKTRPTTDLVSSWGVLQQHLPVVGITEENCFLAQKVAVMANLFPFEITEIESTPSPPTE